MTKKINILFICKHNSGRSQIAEAYVNKHYGDFIHAESAGLEPTASVEPLVDQVMKEEGFDLSKKKPQSVFDLYKHGRLFDHVITVCNESEAQCPIFPGITKRLHWPFSDPAEVQGSDTEKLDAVRRIRDEIKEWIVNPTDQSVSVRDLIGKSIS